MSMSHLRAGVLVLLAAASSSATAGAAEELQARARYDYYTTEGQGEVLILAPDSMRQPGIRARLTREGEAVGEEVALTCGPVTRVPVPVAALPEGRTARCHFTHYCLLSLLLFYERVCWPPTKASGQAGFHQLGS